MTFQYTFAASPPTESRVTSSGSDVPQPFGWMATVQSVRRSISVTSEPQAKSSSSNAASTASATVLSGSSRSTTEKADAGSSSRTSPELAYM